MLVFHVTGWLADVNVGAITSVLSGELPIVKLETEAGGPAPDGAIYIFIAFRNFREAFYR